MPKATSSTKRTKASRRKPVGTTRRRRAAQPKPQSAGTTPRNGSPDTNPSEHPCVVQNGRTTFVMVPIDEYEEMVKREMVQDAIRTLDDPNTEWTDAGDLALEIAADRIAAARKAQGLTQKQLGAKLGLPQSQISRIERKPDRTTVRTLKRIAKALNVDVRVFLAAV